MRSIGLTILSVLLIGGCATPDRIRQSAAPKTFESKKRPEDVVACIVERFDGLGRAKVLELTPRGDGGKTVKRINNRTPIIIGFVADVSPAPGGTVVRLYENNLVIADERAAVESCGVGSF